MTINIVEGSVNQYREGNGVNVFAFGNIQKGTAAKFKIKVNDVDDSSLTVTCGCSASTSDEKNVHTVEYKNTNILEPFSKVLILKYVKNGKQEQTQIKITGNVVNK